MSNVLSKIKKWRKDFGLTGLTRQIPALKMFIEETTETTQACLASDRTEIRDGLIDTLFVTVQLAEAYNIDLEKDLDIVLKSNYTKACTFKEMEEWQKSDLDLEVYELNGLYFGFKNGKLQKPPHYKPPIWE